MRIPSALFSAGLLAAPVLPSAFAEAPVNPRFAEVEKQLDRDGDFYLYLNTRPFFAFVGGMVEKGLALAEKAMAKDAPEETVAKFREGVALARTVVDELGLNQLGDLGASARAIGDGLFRTRFVVGKAAPGDQGLFWKTVPGNGVGLPGMGLIPKDSVVAVSQRLNVGGFWSGFKALVAKTPAQPLLQQGLDQAKSSGFDVEAILGSIGDESAFSLSFDETRTAEFPVVGPVPEPSFLLGIKIKDRTIPLMMNILGAGIKDQVSQTNLMEGVSATVVRPPNLPPLLAPCWAEHKGWLVLASQPSALKRGLQLLGGQGDGLAANAEYLKYAKGLPASGVSFAFVSTRLADVYFSVLKAMIGSQSGSPGAPPAEVVEGLGEVLSGMRDTIGAAAVGEKLPDGGMRSTTVGPFNYSISVSYMTMVLPIAVTAAVALPAITQARMQAQMIEADAADPDAAPAEPEMELPGDSAEPAPAVEPEPPSEEAVPEPVETIDPVAAKKQCSANLQAINKAIQRARFGNSRGPLFPEGQFPVCPSGGEYIMPSSNLELPKCTHQGHTFR